MSAMTTTVRDLTTDEALKDARHALDRAAAMADGPARVAAFAAWAEAWGEPALIALDELQGELEGWRGFDGDEG
jgi:hypothetical protein